jgi:hypothetical protein
MADEYDGPPVLLHRINSVSTNHRSNITSTVSLTEADSRTATTCRSRFLAQSVITDMSFLLTNWEEYPYVIVRACLKRGVDGRKSRATSSPADQFWHPKCRKHCRGGRELQQCCVKPVIRWVLSKWRVSILNFSVFC